MIDAHKDSGASRAMTWRRREALYALALFALAAIALAWATLASGDTVYRRQCRLDACSFFLYGLFTISVGYHHPNIGYYSFDRVAQVASILVLGPLPAAFVNGAASLVYPIHRLRTGTPLRDVMLRGTPQRRPHDADRPSLRQSLHLTRRRSAARGNRRRGDPQARRARAVRCRRSTTWECSQCCARAGATRADSFQGFAIALELGSGATAVLVAVVYNTMDVQLLILLLAVLSLGMVALRQFASMRLDLERIVEERTETLRQKTQALEQLATRDNLTELFNRRYAEGYLGEHIAQAERAGATFCVALCDIDLFKRINDDHSHGIGDDVLMQVAGHTARPLPQIRHDRPLRRRRVPDLLSPARCSRKRASYAMR